MISSTAIAAPAQQGIDLLAGGVAVLLDADLCALSPAELVELAQRLEVVKRRLPSFEHALVAELESRNVAGEFARRSTADLLVEVLRIEPREASGRCGRRRSWVRGGRCRVSCCRRSSNRWRPRRLAGRSRRRMRGS